MAIHYSNGIGRIFETESDDPVAEVKYQLIETDSTKYTRKKWWGEFSTKREIKRLGKYVIQVEDGRKGECVINTNTEGKRRIVSQYYYRFNGRGALGRRFSLGI
jgi:hypothetical protein